MGLDENDSSSELLLAVVAEGGSCVDRYPTRCVGLSIAL